MIRLAVAVILAAAPLSPIQPSLLVDARLDPIARFAISQPVQLDVAREIVAASFAAGIPPDIALETGWRESRFFPDYVSRTRDYGPLQVNARWTPEIVRQTTAQRIATGVRILAEAFRKCGSWAGADHRYRTGRCR